MKPKIQIATKIREARKFIDQMMQNGYHANLDKVSSDDHEHWYFTIDGQTSINYSVYINLYDENAFIGIRPE